MDTRLAQLLLAFTFLFQFLKSESTAAAAKICPRYKCDTSLKSCGSMVSDDTYGKNVTLNGCTNKTGWECLVSENTVMTNTNFNISCSEKPAPPVWTR